eukprot:9975181-Alexandrium_andersonii.AAC.1
MHGCQYPWELFRLRSTLSGQRVCNDIRNAWDAPEHGDVVYLQGIAQCVLLRDGVGIRRRCGMLLHDCQGTKIV